MKPETETPLYVSPADLPPNSNNKRKKLLVLGIVLLVLAVGLLVWLLFLRGDESPQANKPLGSNKPNTNQQQTKNLKPYGLAYSSGSYETEVGLRVQELGTEQYFEENTLEGYVVSDAKVYQNQVVLVASAAAGTTGDAVSVWHSKDSGKTYEKVFAASGDKNETLGPQITSLAFANDGKTVVFGYLPNLDSNNIVREIDLASKKVKDLFTVQAKGVFIQAYDRADKQLYYYSGCYNCDGNMMNKLVMRHIDKGLDTTIYENSSKIGVKTAFNEDLSKVLLLVMDPGEDGIGYGADGVIDEVTIANGAKRTIIPNTEEGAMGDIGYVSGGHFVYYVKGSGVYTVGDQGPAGTLYTGSKPVQNVFYATEDRIILSEGEISDIRAVDYDVATKKGKQLVAGDSNTYLFGVTWK